MKELSSHPRSRPIALPQHDDPLARFSDHEDTGPIDVSAEIRPGSGYHTRPHEIAGYISASGRHTLEPEDAVPDWSMGHAATWEDVDEGPVYVAHRYAPRPPRTVPMVATAAVCGLLAYSLYLDRPDLSQIGSWFTRNDVIELPAISPPPLPSRLADEPGRVATPSLEPVARSREAESAAPTPPPSSGRAAEVIPSNRLDLVVGDSGVSIVPGRVVADDEPRRQVASPTETIRPTEPSPTSFTRALNAASLAPGSTGGANSLATALSRGGDDVPVKRVLTNFQVAYNALDAQGTKRVWPAVDATALARVFRSLESQHLELAGCQVAMTGNRAQAVCNGRTRMVPKDNAKAPRVESRQWTFDLQRTVDRWDVVALNMK